MLAASLDFSFKEATLEGKIALAAIILGVGLIIGFLLLKRKG